MTAGLDAARSSATSDLSIRPPFGVRWKVELGTALRGGPPLIADGRVLVARHAAQGTVVEAFDAGTGQRLWSVPDPGYPRLAYDSGRLFAFGDRRARALDASNGGELWATTLPDASFGDAPVVAGDLVYAQDAEGLWALQAGDGRLRWRVNFDGTQGEPAVAGDRLYATGGCTVAAFDRRDGRQLWGRNRGCHGGGGGRVVLWRDRLFAHNPGEEGMYRAQDGALVPGPTVDAVTGEVGLEDTGRELVGHDLVAGRALWRHAGEGEVLALPGLALRVGEDHLSAFDLATGAQRWGARLIRPRTSTHVGTPAAGQGLVVVDVGTTLVALATAASAPREDVTLRLAKHGNVEAFAAAGVSGATGGTLAALRTRLEVDRFPFGGGFRPQGRERDTRTDGRYVHSARVDRNTRVRVVTSDGRRSRTATIWTYPRIRFSVRQVAGRVRVRLRVRAGRDVRFGGRRTAFYIVRTRQRRLVRLDAARLGGRRGRGRATFRFRPLDRVGRRDFVVACVRGAHRLGLGRADVLSRRCGARTLRF